MKIAVITFGYLCNFISLSVIFILFITVIKVWRLFQAHKFLRANERSMILKVVFSLLAWTSNLFLLLLFTQQMVGMDIRRSVEMGVRMSKAYIVFSSFGYIAILMFAFYFWWLIGLKPINKWKMQSRMSKEDVRDTHEELLLRSESNVRESILDSRPEGAETDDFEDDELV